MNPLHPIFAIVTYGIAFLTAYLLNLKFKIIPDKTRHENIDGLRGFLALGVFIHHSAIWFRYLKVQSWEAPYSNFYVHLGHTSVSFFFMITAFLFVSKLLNTTEQKFNWKTLYISRLFRLTPIYLVSIAILVIVVLIISNWEIKTSTLLFLKDLLYWISFTIIYDPDINNITYTSIINAGVVWSLPLEWLFYFSLPLISLFIIKIKPSLFYVLLSLLILLSFLIFKTPSYHHFLSFLGGAITPFILKYGTKKINYNSIYISLIILTCMGLILLFPSPSDLLCKFLIIIVFNGIALGNNLFGILKKSVLKFLGEISYSTYLLHGILIFCVMYFGIGFKTATRLTPIGFWLTIFAITPILVFISFLGYRYIEKPYIILSKKLTIKN